jgi:hypothetical protein
MTQPRSGSHSAWEQGITDHGDHREHSLSSTFILWPVFPDQHHLLESSSLFGPARTVCGTGIWPGLFCPVFVLLDVCRNARP